MFPLFLTPLTQSGRRAVGSKQAGRQTNMLLIHWTKSFCHAPPIPPADCRLQIADCRLQMQLTDGQLGSGFGLIAVEKQAPKSKYGAPARKHSSATLTGCKACNAHGSRGPPVHVRIRPPWTVESWIVNCELWSVVCGLWPPRLRRGAATHTSNMSPGLGWWIGDWGLRGRRKQGERGTG